MLNELKKRIEEQDNRATQDPIFVVYDWVKLPTTSDYSSDWEYADTYDGYSSIGTTNESLIKWAKNNEVKIPDNALEMDSDDLFDWIQKESGQSLMKNYYFERREYINVFFTEKSAEDFIAQNKHHFTKNVHIYVHSLWRNPEMKYIRNSILNEKFVEYMLGEQGGIRMERVYSDETLQKCYEAGIDAKKNGGNANNSSMNFFTSPERTKAWQKGYMLGEEKC